jgi:hypothetical protein
MSYGEQRDQYGGYGSNPYGGGEGYNQSGNPYASSGVSTPSSGHTESWSPAGRKVKIIS